MNCPEELSDRDWRIVQHVYRYRVSTEPVIGRLFLPEAKLNAARNVVRRLVREGWLRKWTMRGQTRYVTLDSRGYAACGLPNKSPSCFSDQTLPTLFAVLYFCIHHGFERKTPEELRAIDPEFDTQAGWAHAYFVHQLAQSFKYDSELLVILRFQFGDLACEFAIALDQPSHLHKRAHDLNVHGDCTLAAQHAGEHRDTLFGEGVWRLPSTAPT